MDTSSIPQSVQSLANGFEVREIPGFHGYYATKDGRVISVRLHGKARVLKPWIINSGYYALAPCLNGKQVKALVHVMIAKAFHGEKPFDDAEVCHLDDQKLNNHADNLRWDSYVRNYDDAKRNERTPRGERNGQSRLTEADVREIRRLASEGLIPSDIGRQLGFNREVVGKIVRRERWAWLD